MTNAQNLNLTPAQKRAATIAAKKALLSAPVELLNDAESNAVELLDAVESIALDASGAEQDEPSNEVQTARDIAIKTVASLSQKVSDRVSALRADGRTVAVEFKSIQDNFSTSGKHYGSFVSAVEKTQNYFRFSFLESIIGKAQTQGSTDSNYVQAKTIIKVINFVRAFALSDFKDFDNQTRCIVFNTMVNNGVLTARAQFATLCKRAFGDDLSEVLKQTASYSSGTASSQTSSTKEMFRVTGMTNGIKGERDASVDFLPSTVDALKVQFAAFN